MKAAHRMVAWLMLLVIALACGLAFDAATLFWVGILSAWVLTKGGSGD